ncbi:MAG: heme-binding protein, partial [Pseudomonadota bacterium]
MTFRALLYGSALAAALLTAGLARAQEPIVTYKSLSLDLALELAGAALADCRQRGYQAAVAVGDPVGVAPGMLRARVARPHTPATPPGQARTPGSLPTHTT